MLLAALVAALPIELCRDRLGNPSESGADDYSTTLF
jgi:hypothetical protein